AARPTRLAVHDHLRPCHLAVLLEQGVQVVLVGIPDEIADINILRHHKTFPCQSSLAASCLAAGRRGAGRASQGAVYKGRPTCARPDGPLNKNLEPSRPALGLLARTLMPLRRPPANRNGSHRRWPLSLSPGPSPSGPAVVTLLSPAAPRCLST